jgi:hypothetical protein
MVEAKAKAGRTVQPLGAEPEEELRLADFEHLGAAGWADALGGGAGILHGDGFGALHLPLGAALDTITLNASHGTPPFGFVS